MKKLLLFLAPAVLVAGCATDPLEEIAAEGTRAASKDAINPQTKARSLEGAVYNEVVDAWMIPQADPYTLANFQAAYDKLSAKKSTQTLTKEQAAEFSASKRLAPTHYALKIYPKSEEEQWKVEMMEDVQVAYIPFDWVQLTRDEVEKLPQTKTKSLGTASAKAFTFPEKSPYTVTYDYTDATDGGPTGPVTYQLPILYTVWPVSKPLPTDLEYVVDYEIFLPDVALLDKSVNEKAVQALWGEAVALARGTVFANPLYAWPLEGFLTTYDNTPGVMRDVPLANLKVRYQDGSLMVDKVTESTGRFTISIPIPSAPVPTTKSFPGTLTFTYQDPQGRWKIVKSGYSVLDINTPPITESKNMATIVWTPMSGGFPLRATISLEKGDRQVNEIHRAVNYFYNVQNVFTEPNWPGGINIVANTYPDPDAGGFFWMGGNEELGIKTIGIDIFNHGFSNSIVIGYTLHELGHYAHFCVVGEDEFWDVCNFMLKESFADYSGWYWGEEYYKSLGWPQNGASNITGCGRLNWTNSSSGSAAPYTPLFIDLTDSYNHSSFDNFQGLSPSSVWYTITHSTTWAECKSILNSYYPGNQLNSYFDYYQVWFNNNPRFLP